jgi:RNA polymerase sigma factor (sigma-70 family)
VDLSDTELLRRARRDPDAFCVFYDRHAEQLHRWLIRETGDVHAATDLTAETFAQALKSLWRFRGDHDGAGTAWLWSIARRLLCRFRERGRLETRARRRLGMSTDGYHDDALDEVDERLAYATVLNAARQILGRLPLDQQRAVQLRVVDGLPYASVARELGCSEQAARLRVSRAMRRLRACLEGEHV